MEGLRVSMLRSLNNKSHAPGEPTCATSAREVRTGGDLPRLPPARYSANSMMHIAPAVKASVAAMDNT
jgi:hypothetical protein